MFRYMTAALTALDLTRDEAWALTEFWCPEIEIDGIWYTFGRSYATIIRSDTGAVIKLQPASGLRPTRARDLNGKHQEMVFGPRPSPTGC